MSAGDPLHDRSDLVRRGYARVTDPKSADSGLMPAFAIDWVLEMLGWKNPASPAQVRRCVDVIARHTTPQPRTIATSLVCCSTANRVIVAVCQEQARTKVTLISPVRSIEPFGYAARKPIPHRAVLAGGG